ncbi:FemAB family XrtA/PEP-CTERM system-associated protein [Marinobacter lutaoensis]|uniref:FemAB family XrtA/PEP-CTERM system-associated protein n=1 Tax=Marinobacter lutaoensis TaxID=135739 RepID=UPI0015945F3B|nr:FemAB family XrtA/PEP-CTERM system-associated protein [Marinobacter lutaoensis]NVD36671.1 FemAB family PEP-CTERM system-associated protein [Marinobacter lutaoensis]
MSTDMDVRVSRHSVFPIEDYDRYVGDSPRATPYHASAWLQAIEKAYGHTAWIVSGHRGGALCGVLPLVEVRRPIGQPILVSLPFCDLAGPLADEPALEERLVQAARDLARTNGIARLQVRSGGRAVAPEAIAAGDARDKVRMLMPLPRTSADLFQSFKPKLRSQVRKAEKNGLTSQVRTDPEALDPFYRVFSANMRRLGSPVHSRSWFRELQRSYGERLLVGLVHLGDTPVGAGIVLIQGDRASIPWASTLAEHNHLAPNMLLYWTLLSRVCDSGCREFDFGRSTLGEGTYRFKKQWGAVAHELIWRDGGVADDASAGTRSPATGGGWMSGLRPLVELLWSRLPPGLVNWLGPKLRRYITL